jgi:hypothetical protein
MELTKRIADHIGSDLSLVVAMLDGLAASAHLQQGDFYGNKTNELIEQRYFQYANTIDKIFVLDDNDEVAISFDPDVKGIDPNFGTDLSSRDWVKETRINRTLVTSGAFERQNIYKIFMTFPIINRNTNEYIGTLGTSIPTVPFFSHYGSLESIDSRFLVVFDNKGTILANGASDTLLGQNFFSEYVQNFVNHNGILNNLSRSLFAGNSGYAVYDYGTGERLMTQHPVFINGKPMFFIQAVTPTTEIYPQIENALNVERSKMVLLLSGTTLAIVVLVVLLIKWNSILKIEVERKTQELYEAESKSRELEESFDAMKDYVQQVLEEIKGDVPKKTIIEETKEI